MSRLIFILISFAMVSCSYLSLEGVKEDHAFFSTTWSKNIDPVYETGNLPIALNSPLIHDGMLYVGDGDNNLRAYQLDNGRPVWSAADKGGYHAGLIPVSGKLIYGTVQGRLYSRDLLTGEEKFSVDLGASIETTPVFYKGRLLLQTRDHRLVCLDAETGKILWAYKRSVPFLTTVQRASMPLIADNRIYIGFADGSVVALSVEEGMVLWENKVADGSKFVDVDSTPVLFGNKLFVSSMAGHIAVLRPDTGILIRKLPFISTRAPVVDGERLVVGTVDGEVIVYDRELRPIAQQLVASGLISSIVVWKNHYVLSTVRGELIAIEKNKLAIKEKLHLGHSASAVFGQLQSDGTYMSLLSSRNRLYVFK